jgi:hypothetical protein
MKRLGRLLKGFYSWCADGLDLPEATFTLGVYRVVFGVFFLCYLVVWAPGFFEYSTGAGFLASPPFGGSGKSSYFDMWPSLYYYFDESQIPVGSVLFVLVGAAVCFTLGFYTRVASLVIYVGWCSVVDRNGLLYQGEFGLFRMAMFYHIFLPMGESFSLRAYLLENKRDFPGSLFWAGLTAWVLSSGLAFYWGAGALTSLVFLSVAFLLGSSVFLGRASPRQLTFRPFFLRIFQLNLALVYVLSVVYKLVDDVSWRDGTALYWVALSPRWGLSPHASWVATALGGYLVVFLTYWTLFCEAFFALFVWFRQTRLLACLLLFQLHLGIALTTNGVLGFNLAALLTVFVFLRQEDYRFLGGGFRRVCWGLLRVFR